MQYAPLHIAHYSSTTSSSVPNISWCVSDTKECPLHASSNPSNSVQHICWSVQRLWTLPPLPIVWGMVIRWGKTWKNNMSTFTEKVRKQRISSRTIRIFIFSIRTNTVWTVISSEQQCQKFPLSINDMFVIGHTEKVSLINHKQVLFFAQHLMINWGKWRTF